jgi:dihydrolipoamide dehydrogenase
LANEYDLLVIGSGTGGYVAAIRGAQLGLKVGCIEKEPVLGGTCLNWGCIPTKALLEHAHAFKVMSQAKEWGVTIGGAVPTGPVGIDMPAVHARKDKIVKGLTDGIAFLFKKNKVEWIKGTARLLGKGAVEVTTGDQKSTYTAKDIVVATGSTARSVPGITIDHQRIITSDDALHMKEVPKSIIVLGSGAVGVEFASIYNRFGAQVTIIELLPRIVPNEDEAVSAELERAFKKIKIKVLTGSKVTSATPSATSVAIEVATADGKTEKMTADYLLVATGRGPVTTSLGAEEAGLTMEKGYIKVDELLRTSVPGISAVGDVITLGTKSPHPQLAHLSSAEGILVAERIAGKEVRPINYEHVPGCTYCDPEIGSVGLTEKEAKDRGYDVRIGTFPFKALGRARMANETEGFVKIVAEKKYDEILGVHIIGLRATELIAEATLMLRMECTVEELIRTIHAHPTMSEAVGEAAHGAHGAAIHV